jgi:hypothetical protein
MHNSRFLKDGHDEIERQILSMPFSYQSDGFLNGFARSSPQIYEHFIRIYTSRGHDRPRAIQIVHSQLMHTVSDRFPSLTRKIRTISNPKGGDMSLWVRL